MTVYCQILHTHTYAHAHAHTHIYVLCIYISITFIDKMDLKDPNRHEHYWRHTLRTMAPDGLNIEDD